MNGVYVFVFNSILLGVGLAMDAFSVSVANGLQEPGMRRRKAVLIAGTFAFFQFLMPVIGWCCVHTIMEYFVFFGRIVPVIAFLLLVFIGGKMVLEGVRTGSGEGEEETGRLSGTGLFVQGIATSIDALSVGFTIASYSAGKALSASVLIAVTTFVLCMAGIRLGKYFGMRIAGRATVPGGLILIAIGIRILLGGSL